MLYELPHAGIRVPDAGLQVSSLRELPTPDGVAYTATERRGRIPVGTIHNEGMGGLSALHPAAGSSFGPRQLAAVVAASRTADGHPIREEQLLEDFITEYEHTKEVTSATRLGRCPLRLRALVGSLVGGLVGDDDYLAGEYYTARHATAAKVTTAAQLEALIADLRRKPNEPGQWWQLWIGERWEDLTQPPAPRPAPDA